MIAPAQIESAFDFSNSSALVARRIGYYMGDTWRLAPRHLPSSTVVHMSTSDRTAASTFNRVAFDLTHEAFPGMAAAIRARNDQILKHWRERSLNAMPHLDALTREEFENAIAEILSAAADALQSADPRQLRGVVESGPHHGIRRFMQKLSLLDLFEEVRILRGVIIFEMADQMRRPLQPAEAATFHAIFDIIIQQGVMALVDKQNEMLERSHATTAEMNERLLVSSLHQHELTAQARNSEAALRESEDRYRTLFDLGPVAVYSCDAAGVIQDFNHRAAELWGRTPAPGDTDERFCGSFKMFRPDGTFMPHERCPMAEVLSGAIPFVRDGEVHIERPDGSRIVVIVTIRPLKDQQRQITGAINCFYDITSRQQAEEELRQSKHAAEAASRAKDLFLAALSHELRTPLTPVLMTLTALESQSDLPADVRDELTMIKRNVELESKLIDDLLDLSRITSGKLRLTFDRLDVNDLLRHVCQTCRPSIQERGIRLHCDLAHNAWDVVGDPGRLQQVFWNLLNNAAKFTPEGGNIYVTTENVNDNGRDGQVRVTVRDSGKGIAAEILPRIFDAFEQGDISITRQFGGLGLGLAISKLLVERHRGTIRAQSAGPNQGATFLVELPALPQTQAAVHAPAQSPADGAGRAAPLRLMVVEDHVDTAAALRRLLAASGHTVETANTAAAALALAAQRPFDIVISDLGLPDMTGYELMKRIWENHGIKGIAMSGYGMEEDIKKGERAGFSDHLVKPVNMTQLEQSIRRVAAMGDGDLNVEGCGQT